MTATPAPGSGIARRKPGAGLRLRDRLSTIGFLAPAVVLIGVFIIVPMLITIWLSFQSWRTSQDYSTATFVGFKNFTNLFSDSVRGRDFRQALGNTFIYAGLMIAITLPLSVMFGVIIHRQTVRGTTALRTILFASYTVPMIAVALIFSKLYSPTEGPINQMLGWVGIAGQPWLSSTSTALISLVILNVWQQLGFFTILVIAGLTQISPTVYEAAAIDGARPTSMLFRITIPLLRRTLLFNVVIGLINAIQVFEPVQAITQGGPIGSTEVLTHYIRSVGIEKGAGGLASSMAVVLLVALIVIVTLIFALMRGADNQ